jgi:flagellar hook-length control protein FliK
VEIPEQARQIRAEITQNLENESMEFQMRLKPEELGRVNVKMVLEGGRLAVEIAAAQQKSAELLQKQSAALAESLKASGVEVDSIRVVTANEKAGAEMNAQYDLLNNSRSQQGSAGHSRRGSRNHHSRGTAGGHAASAAAAIAREEHQRILNKQI